MLRYQTMDIYTDGSCLGNPGRGGWGFISFMNGVKQCEQGGSKKFTTNNEMELLAIDKALTHILESECKKFNFYTDSNYAKQGITTWSKNWKRNNWKSSTGNQIKNIDLWKSITEKDTKLKNEGVIVDWYWVKAHSSNAFNNQVDILARSHAEMA